MFLHEHLEKHPLFLQLKTTCGNGENGAAFNKHEKQGDKRILLDNSISLLQITMHDSIQVGNEIVEFGEFGGTSVRQIKALLTGSKEAATIQIQCIYNNYNI